MNILEYLKIREEYIKKETKRAIIKKETNRVKVKESK